MIDTTMTSPATQRPELTLSWAPVRDRQGRVRMEARWIPASSPAARRTAA